MIEEWKQIPGFTGYEISNMGNFRGYKYCGGLRKEPHALMPMYRRGKKLITLNAGGKKIRKQVINLMVETWMPEYKNRKAYNINGNIDDCRLDNIAISNDYSNYYNLNAKAVCKFDADGNIVKVYPSIKKAAEDNYMNRVSMANRCYGRHCKKPFIVDGYTYRFANNEERSIDL